MKLVAKNKGHALKCIGGPWHKQYVWLPYVPFCNHDQMTLHIKVGDHAGRYNTRTGVWQSDGQS
jgi:hypothetical protein